MKIKERLIGRNVSPFVIAEMSGNHNHSLQRALEIVEAAAKSGAHAIKLQTYTADTITLDISDNEFFINDPDNLWVGTSLYDLYASASTPWEWHEPIMQKAADLGLICFSTPFDESAVDFLETLNVPAYKIASFENNHLPLVRKVASTGKPLIISLGMATIAEIDEVVRTARDAGCQDIILLKCTSSYPASPEDSNIISIPYIRTLFDCEVGISDHTLGVGASIAAVAHGASVIEKHFTLSRSDGGVDSAFSMEPDEMTILVRESLHAWLSLGKVHIGPNDSERKSRVFRRSLYVTRDMKAGELFTPQNLRCIRPGLGLEPKYYETILGKRVNQDIRKGTAMKWELLG